MSAITEFYCEAGQDGEGRRVEEILAWPDSRLEAVHDYIQWLFPLPEPSGANPWAPVLSAGDIAAIRGSERAQARLRDAFARMLAFYGLMTREGRIEKGAAFEERARNWLHPGNHNHLRITRILRSLGLLGREAESRALWEFLQRLYQEERDAGRSAISERSFDFWRRAAAASRANEQ
jgi:hypothetical protein